MLHKTEIKEFSKKNLQRYRYEVIDVFLLTFVLFFTIEL